MRGSRRNCVRGRVLTAYDDEMREVAMFCLMYAEEFEEPSIHAELKHLCGGNSQKRFRERPNWKAWLAETRVRKRVVLPRMVRRYVRQLTVGYVRLEGIERGQDIRSRKLVSCRMVKSLKIGRLLGLGRDLAGPFRPRSLTSFR